MPLKCAMSNCMKTKGMHFMEDDNTTPLSFFRFKSQNAETIKEWIKLCGRSDLTPDNSNSNAICSMHFQQSDVEGNRITRARIKNGTLPSRNLPDLKESSNIVTSPEKITCKSKKRKSNYKYDYLMDAMKIKPVHPVTVNKILPHWHFEKADGMTWYFQVHSSNNSVPCVNKSVKVPDDGSAAQFYIGTEELSKKACQDFIGKLSMDNEEGFMLILKLFSNLCIKEDPMKSVVRKLEGLLDDNEKMDPSEEDDDAAAANKFLRFMTEQFNMYSTSQFTRRWDPDVVRWATTLHLYSPAAYNFVCNSGYVLLPSARTLSRYTTSGVTSDVKKDDQCVADTIPS